MYTGIKHLHSSLAYISLLLLIVAVLYAIYSFVNKTAFVKKSKTIALLGLIGAHLQLLIGLMIYFVSPLGLANFSGESMKNSVSRLYILEHPLTMIIAIALITVGYSKAKRQTNDAAKFKSIAIFYSIGLFLILLRIPWQAWF